MNWIRIEWMHKKVLFGDFFWKFSTIFMIFFSNEILYSHNAANPVRNLYLNKFIAFIRHLISLAGSLNYIRVRIN